jgi:hypothetical protein
VPQKPSERDYKHEYARDHSKPEQIKNRGKRNKARALLKKKGVAVAGKDVGHKKALIHGGSNNASNLRVETVAGNRGFARGKSNRPKH